ncbi:MAG: N-acetylneuraminate synthase [Candidatus Heimdallarchaeota archaeon]
MRTVRIGGNFVGENNICFIIAEAGVNHNGSIHKAKKMVEVAKACGADAVKFQTFTAERLVTSTAEKAPYQKEQTDDGSQFDMLKSLELTSSEFTTLAKHAEKTGIMFLSTPFDQESADFLETLEIAAYKISSGDLTNLPMLKHIARKAKPMILSTGMGDIGEVNSAISTITQAGLKEIILLHCVTSYPAPLESLNLKAITTLREAFDFPVGFSDHTTDVLAPVIARALGACVIEKHFTLDKNLPGPDHKTSLTPQILEEMITTIRKVELALGDGIKKPAEIEIGLKSIVQRSIVAKADISVGKILEENMLDVKRPGTGIAPKFLDDIIGKRSKTQIKKDQLITWEMIE